MDSINTRAAAIEQTDTTTWFRASTNDIDRHGTIVEPRGIDTANYSANPVFMWGHDAYGSGGGPPDLENVLGRVIDYRKDDSAFDIEVEWAEHDRAVMARDLVRTGFLSAVSVGFIPDPDSLTTRAIEGSAPDADDDFEAPRPDLHKKSSVFFSRMVRSRGNSEAAPAPGRTSNTTRSIGRNQKERA